MNKKDFIKKFDTQSQKAINNYIKNSNEENFQVLFSSFFNEKNSQLSEIIYYAFSFPLLRAKIIRHLILSLYTEARHLETAYYCLKYRGKFSSDKVIARIFAMSSIEAGLLGGEEFLLKDSIALGEDPYVITTIRLAYCLRENNLERAHILALELFYKKNCQEPGIGSIIEAAERVNDIELLLKALLKAKSFSVELELSKRKINRIKSLLIKRLLTIISEKR